MEDVLTSDVSSLFRYLGDLTVPSRILRAATNRDGDPLDAGDIKDARVIFWPRLFFDGTNARESDVLLLLETSTGRWAANAESKYDSGLSNIDCNDAVQDIVECSVVPKKLVHIPAPVDHPIRREPTTRSGSIRPLLSETSVAVGANPTVGFLFFSLQMYKDRYLYGGVNELMAVNRRLSMRRVKEILRLGLSLGLEVRQIARSCSVSHSTVSEIPTRARILARLRNRTFLGLEELKEDIWEALEDLNNGPFTRWTDAAVRSSSPWTNPLFSPYLARGTNSLIGRRPGQA
jgi:hypothetical protein